MAFISSDSDCPDNEMLNCVHVANLIQQGFNIKEQHARFSDALEVKTKEMQKLVKHYQDSKTFLATHPKPEFGRKSLQLMEVIAEILDDPIPRHEMYRAATSSVGHLYEKLDRSMELDFRVWEDRTKVHNQILSNTMQEIVITFKCYLKIRDAILEMESIQGMILSQIEATLMRHHLDWINQRFHQ